MTARTVLSGGRGADLACAMACLGLDLHCAMAFPALDLCCAIVCPDLDLACATVCPALDLRCATACPLRPTFHGGGVALDPISLSKIHEDLRLERHKHMPHSSECTWPMLHTFRGRRFMAAARLWIRYHSQEFMKTSASKGINI